MKQKSRKLFSRVGAALMLGLSLFNFGAAWNKLRGGAMPRRARNIRKQTKEQVDSDISQVAEIAEEEVRVVLAAEQLEEEQSQQQAERESTSFFQASLRYVAITVWAVSAGLVFTSVVFNYPFAMGKGLLSFLPGEPHVTSVSLMSQKEHFQVGDEIQVDVKLNTNGEVVEKMKIVVDYDPEILDFQRFNFKQEIFSELLEKDINQNEGKLALSFGNSAKEVIAKGETIGSLFFESLGTTEKSKVNLVESESVVIKNKNGQPHNILGKTSPASFEIEDRKVTVVVCNEIESEEGVDLWRGIVQGKILPQQDDPWNEIGDEWSFVCAHQEGKEVFLVVSGATEDLSKVSLELGGKFDFRESLKVDKGWYQDGRFFLGFSLGNVDAIQISDASIQGIKFRVNTENKSLHWPQGGSATFMLESQAD